MITVQLDITIGTWKFYQASFQLYYAQKVVLYNLEVKEINCKKKQADSALTYICKCHYKN